MAFSVRGKTAIVTGAGSGIFYPSFQGLLNEQTYEFQQASIWPLPTPFSHEDVTFSSPT